MGSAAWARRVPPPAAPPRRPPQSASSLSASRRPPGALETFPRPSPTPCSWPGLWQSPYGPGPPCAGCPLLTAGRGRGPRGHARRPSLPASLEQTQQLRPPPRWGPGVCIHSRGLLSPYLCVYPPIKHAWCPWTKLPVAAQSPCLGPPTFSPGTCLALPWLGVQPPELDPEGKAGWVTGRPVAGRNVTGRSPAAASTGRRCVGGGCSAGRRP